MCSPPELPTLELHSQEEAHHAPAVLLRLDSEARAGWDRMLTAGQHGATLVIAARGGEQLDEMLAGLQEGPADAQVSAGSAPCQHPRLAGVMVTSRPQGWSSYQTSIRGKARV